MRVNVQANRVCCFDQRKQKSCKDRAATDRNCSAYNIVQSMETIDLHFIPKQDITMNVTV